MNQDQIRGLWGQLKGRAKIAHGDLTNDEGRRVEGTTDHLYGRLQQKFGDAKQAVRRGIDRLRMP
jgi:uncharacterized protein YjbJ (UPF0337 family)